MKKNNLIPKSIVVIFLTFFISPLFSFLLFLPIYSLLEEKQTIKKKLGLSYLFFFLYNIIPTFWLANVQIKEGLLTWSVNSLLMTTVFFVSILFSKRKEKYVIFIFTSLWIFFELIHHIWIFNWPWLSLGNIFCTSTIFIQWYSYTGILGGTIWILLVNYFIYKIYYKNEHKSKVYLFSTIIAPIIVSLLLYFQENKFNKSINIIITQPNSNSLLFKNNELQLLNKICDSVSKLSISTPTVLLLTETFIKENIWDNRLQDCRALQKINNIILDNNNISCVTGVIMKQSGVETKINRDFGNNSVKTFDAAVYNSSKYKAQFHFKSKLIPIEEYMPNYLKGFGFMSDNFSIGNDFNSFKINDSVNLSAGICYEIIFGHSIAKMINNNTGAILILTNVKILR